MDIKIDKGLLRWFSYVERMENNRAAKKVYVGERAFRHSVGRPWKRWIDIGRDCLRRNVRDVIWGINP